jgi:hypothetical protein
MCKTMCTMAMVAVLFFASLANAEITCEQVGGDLYVTGTDEVDDVVVSASSNHDVLVVDVSIMLFSRFYGVDKVWVSTGDGADNLRLASRGGTVDMYADTGNDPDTVDSRVYDPTSVPTVEIYTGNGDDYVYSMVDGSQYWNRPRADLVIDTGNGDDRVISKGYYADKTTVNIVTGNGMDYVDFYADSNQYWQISIDTGFGDDTVKLTTSSDFGLQLAVQLGHGDDVLLGSLLSTLYKRGTIDGGRGEDDRSGFTDRSNRITIMNFEY